MLVEPVKKDIVQADNLSDDSATVVSDMENNSEIFGPDTIDIDANVDFIDTTADAAMTANTAGEARANWQ